MNKLLLYLLIQVVAVAFSFKLRCPVSGEWRLRSKKFNCSSSQYVCLLHIRYRLDNIYMESCDGFDYSSKGSKLVFEPFFNKAQCSFKRYQPFTFSTDGSSQCVYQKSYCQEDGQFVFHKSSSQNDSTCGCNSSNGYRFVTKPKNNCYCIPSEEDCSCVKITCDNIYNHCPNDGVTIMNTTCSYTTNEQLPDIHKPSLLPNNDLITKKHLMNKQSRGRMCSLQCAYFTGVILIVMLITVPVYVVIINQLLPVVTVVIKRKEIVSYGTEINLSCNIITKVKLRSVQWFKGEEPIHSGSSETFLGKDNQIRSKLTLPDIKETDIGVYSCEVHNAIGSNKSENIQLVLALPVVTIESKKKEILKYGTKIVVSCEIKSESKLQSVQWYKGNVPVNAALSETHSESNNTITSILIINESKESDIGVYTCEAQNEVGSTMSDSLQVVYDSERQKFIHELVRKGECGKHYFARVVFIGKNGVGKTSLMNRLIWQKKEVATCTNSTDGIEIEKCNINVVNGKWSSSDKKDDDLIKLISQVYAGKRVNEERSADESITEHNVVQVLPNSRADESESIQSLNSVQKTTHTNEKQTKISTVTTSVKESYDTEIKMAIKNVKEEMIEKRINPGTVELITTNDLAEHVNEKEEKNKNEKNEIKKKEEKGGNTIEEQEEKDENEIKKKEEKDENDENSINVEKNVNEEIEKKIDIMTSAIMDSYFQRIEVESSDTLASCWLWDFAGQKDFYATHQAFLSKCAVYILVTDKLEASYVEKLWTDFDSTAEYVRFRFNSIHCYRPIDPFMSITLSKKQRHLDPPVIVVCTNEDKFKGPIERKNRQEQFKINLRYVLDEKSKAHIRNIYFVSNTDDDDAVFERIRENISIQAMQMNDWGKDCPLKWLLFQQVLGKLKDTDVPISTTESLKKIAKHKDIGITNDEEFNHCLQYYHDIGTIIFFDEETLRNNIILDPKWLVNAFRCLVSDKISDIINLSHDWKMLKERGELTDSLISLLFEKEPQLKFVENKAHLLEVMKRFDIVVNVKNSDTLYMPCMMEACSFTAMQEKFMDSKHVFNRTSWLCFQFNFLPPVFFHHVLAWCIKNEQWYVSEIIDRESSTKRFALYRQIGVFNLDKSGCEQLVICEAPNVIALQVWNSGSSEKTYETLSSIFFKLITNICYLYRLNVSFIKTFKCRDGDFVFDRKEMLELLKMEFRCNEHKCNHLSDDLLLPWGFTEEKQEVIERHQSFENAQAPSLLNWDSE